MSRYVIMINVRELTFLFDGCYFYTIKRLSVVFLCARTFVCVCVCVCIIYIYIYIYVCVCVCMCVCVCGDLVCLLLFHEDLANKEHKRKTQPVFL